MKGLNTLLSKETLLPVYIAEDPLDCVAKGAGMLLEEIDTLKATQTDKRGRSSRW